MLSGRLEGVRRYLAPYPEVYLHPGLFPATAGGLADQAIELADSRCMLVKR
jgi:hypothetical protein